MCYGCWAERGKPSKVTPEIIAAADAVKRLYEFSCVGGAAHIVTDDWNIEARCIDWCIKHAKDHWSDETPGAVEAALDALYLLRKLKINDRSIALALEAGYIDREGNETPDPNADKPPPFIITQRF